MIFTPLDTDDFNRTDSANLGTEWDPGYTGYLAWFVSGNSVRCEDNTVSLERFNATQPSNDQYAQAVIAQLGPSNQWATAVRMAAPATPTMYLGFGSHLSGDEVYNLSKVVSDVYTELAVEDPAVADLAANDVWKTVVIGTNLYIFQNDVEILSASDSAIASGYAGLWGIAFPSLGGIFRFDDFEVGDVTASASAPVFRGS